MTRDLFILACSLFTLGVGKGMFIFFQPLYLQSFGKWLATIMQVFTFFGEEDFFLIAMPVIYWCVDAALGLRVAVALILGNSLNGILKLLFHAPRPF